MESSNQQKRDRREWTIINLFASSYNSFPIGCLEKSERPDFILTTERKRIGIELTELKYERNDTEFNLRAHEDFLSRIMDEALSIYSADNELVLVVDVRFSDSIAPMVAMEQGAGEAELIRRGLSESIAHIVIDNLPEATGKHYRVDRTSKYGDTNLPRMIESVDIANVTGRMDEPLWYAGISTRIKPVSVESIAQRIKDKDNKLKGYNHACDEQWLIIIQNSFLMSSRYDPEAARHALRHRYPSDFNRVFLFERSRAQVTMLNIIRRQPARR